MRRILKKKWSFDWKESLENPKGRPMTENAASEREEKQERALNDGPGNQGDFGRGHGHDEDHRPGRGLGHDREDKNGRALGHRKDKCAERDEEVCKADPILFVGNETDEAIAGGCKADELYGGRGDDVIVGGNGNDYLSGNWGADIMFGGAGADTFCFDGDYDGETVADFSVADGDRLRFILYTPEQMAWNAEQLLQMFEQNGDDASMTLPGTDETVRLNNVDVADLSVDMISVGIVAAESDLLV